VFKKILIANRGEVANRIIKTCKKLDIEPVPVYSTSDSSLPYLRNVNDSICIGPSKGIESYLNREAILQAAINSECQAIHPGFGFLAEDPLFAYMCEQQKLTFIGPSSESISLMGNKSVAKKTFRDIGLDTIPGSAGNLDSIDHAVSVANEIGYPVLLKATSGGGGKGIRICRDKKDLIKNFPDAVREAENSFSNGELYLEKMITNAHHIEFQILGDSFGNIINLGERDCSIQRKNQKLIEETPSPSLNEKTRSETGEKLISSLEKIGYKNAGTVEFLMDDSDHLYFMEMNTRLQVEHPVTEMVTGIDIVEEQIKIAMNMKLIDQKNINNIGHSIECRINAEDPFNDFSPSPGKISKFSQGTDLQDSSVRIDSFVENNYEIPVFYDSMIAKIIVHCENREKAVQKMEKVLKNLKIEGVKTTIPIHLEILGSKNFRSGKYHNRFLENFLKDKYGKSNS